MFYVIALAGAHKKVISQLKEQLAIVCISDSMQCEGLLLITLCAEICRLCDFFYFQRRVGTSASWSTSCARLRGTHWSNPRSPDRSPAARTGAAPATTQASPATSVMQWSWHILHQSPSHMCEARRGFSTTEQAYRSWTKKIQPILCICFITFVLFLLFTVIALKPVFLWIC